MSLHHPDETLLMEYSAGSLSEAMALCVRLHLDRCPMCRGQLDMLNSLGAVMMEKGQPQPFSQEVSPELFDYILKEIGLEEESARSEPIKARSRPTLEDPLLKLLGQELSELPWKKQLGDVMVCDITHRFPDTPKGQTVTLQKLTAGGRAPAHTHRGTETTVVLRGAFADNTGVFEAGDIQILDDRDEHRPIALHGEDCYCLAVSTAPVRLTGTFTRLLNPFIH